MIYSLEGDGSSSSTLSTVTLSSEESDRNNSMVGCFEYGEATVTQDILLRQAIMKREEQQKPDVDQEYLLRQAVKKKNSQQNFMGIKMTLLEQEQEQEQPQPQQRESKRGSLIGMVMGWDDLEEIKQESNPYQNTMSDHRERRSSQLRSSMLGQVLPGSRRRSLIGRVMGWDQQENATNQHDR